MAQSPPANRQDLCILFLLIHLLIHLTGAAATVVLGLYDGPWFALCYWAVALVSTGACIGYAFGSGTILKPGVALLVANVAIAVHHWFQPGGILY